MKYLGNRGRLAIALVIALTAVPGQTQTRPPSAGAAVPAVQTASPTSTSSVQRAVLDQYCVTCHNDRAKTANLSLEKLDLTMAGDHPELWEKVIRKLRAGVMPPAGVRRPPAAEYDGLRDWLESQVDRKAATNPNPGSIVLHRLNRTEYANGIRDLLNLEIDPAAYLPSDDAARGFDNVAGSLTI